VIAFQQNLAATTDTHHAVAKIIEPRLRIPRTHEEDHGDRYHHDLYDPLQINS
jgi:hypothetical protein